MHFQVFLGWPTSIAFSPVDGTLHILDKTTNLVLKVTPENKVAIVAGRPSHCPEVIYKKSGLGLLGKYIRLNDIRQVHVSLIFLFFELCLNHVPVILT